MNQENLGGIYEYSGDNRNNFGGSNVSTDLENNSRKKVLQTRKDYDLISNPFDRDENTTILISKESSQGNSWLWNEGSGEKKEMRQRQSIVCGLWNSNWDLNNSKKCW